jgi:hypothetical protein
MQSMTPRRFGISVSLVSLMEKSRRRKGFPTSMRTTGETVS